MSKPKTHWQASAYTTQIKSVPADQRTNLGPVFESREEAVEYIRERLKCDLMELQGRAAKKRIEIQRFEAKELIRKDAP